MTKALVRPEKREASPVGRDAGQDPAVGKNMAKRFQVRRLRLRMSSRWSGTRIAIEK